MIRTRRWEPFVYLGPAGVVILGVFLYPILSVVQMSTVMTLGNSVQFVGLRNYQLLLGDPEFQQAVLNAVTLLAIIPVLLVLAVILSALLYERVRGWQIYRSITFLPYVIAVAVCGIVWSYVLRLEGPLNDVLNSLGLSFLALDWLGQRGLSLLAIMLVMTWRELGFVTLLFLARLMSVPEELFEAARIDGANWHQVIWNVMVPQLMPVIEFCAVIEMITVLAWAFDYVYVMTSGGPEYSSMVIDFYIYVRVFRDHMVGMATAASVFLLILSSVLMVLRQRLSARLELA